MNINKTMDLVDDDQESRFHRASLCFGQRSYDESGSFFLYFYFCSF